jgi:hypothetical protein
MKTFKLIVAGSRGFSNVDVFNLYMQETVRHVMLKYNQPTIEIVSGMARGADAMGAQFAELNELKLYKFPAEWDKYGKSAGYRRNAEMGRMADGLVAFWDGKSRGTQHMIETIRDLNKELIIVNF